MGLHFYSERTGGTPLHVLTFLCRETTAATFLLSGDQHDHIRHHIRLLAAGLRVQPKVGLQALRVPRLHTLQRNKRASQALAQPAKPLVSAQPPTRSYQANCQHCK